VVSEHRVVVDWRSGGEEFSYESYSRNHVWRFAGGEDVPASAAPEYKGDPARVDPEAALVAAISSCHMLTFLVLAAKKRFAVASYVDDAVGVMEKNEEGRVAVTRVTLRPAIAFEGERLPSAADLDKLHHQAHEHCFIANSVRTEVTVEAPGS
jgi:organic hydroperoxide reductase OsmC/OhrA